MKKVILLLFVFSVFVPPALAVQRFVNKDFESSRIGYYGWNFWDGNTGRSDYSAVLDTTVKKSGRNGVKVQVGQEAGPYGNVASVYQSINSPDYAGKSVKFSAWCRTENGGKAGLKINIIRQNGTRDTNWTPSVTAPVECSSSSVYWKKIETNLVIIPNDVVKIELEGVAQGQNGTVWFDSFDLQVSPDLPIVAVDQRFGFGGSPQMAQDLNIPWYYNWTINPPTLGRKSFLTIGKIGNNCGNNNNLATLESQSLRDSEDRAWYGRLDIILKKFEGRQLTNGKQGTDYGGGTVCASLDSMRVDFLKVATDYSINYQGTYYQVANEPDWYPYFTPEDYADYYNIFYSRIKKYDPSAQINVGGLLSMSRVIWSSASWGDKYRDYKWIDDFRNIYKTKFGSFPPVSAWSVHPYSDGNWENAKQYIIDFHNYLVSRGETAPIWITEFGPLMTEGDFTGNHCVQHGCLSEEQQNQEWNAIANNYLKPLINWLKSTNYVQKWFWFYAGQTVWWMSDPNAKNYAGEVYMVPSGDYNPIGLIYKQLAEEGAEKIPNCSITSGPTTIAFGETVNYEVSSSSINGNLGTKLSVSQSGNKDYSQIKTIVGTFSQQSEREATGTFSWKPEALGTYDVFCRAWNDGIAECRGNVAYVDGSPRYECTGPNAYMTVNVIIAGDFNRDNVVNLVDFGVWKGKYLAGQMSLVEFGVWKRGYLGN